MPTIGRTDIKWEAANCLSYRKAKADIKLEGREWLKFVSCKENAVRCQRVDCPYHVEEAK